MKLFY